jgi:flagellar protein FliS
MIPTPSDEYLRNAVMTAPPEQLQLMLYDGAIRFAAQGRDALKQQNYETACEKLIRAQRIVTELQNGLRPEINPSLCEQLASLYGFVYRRLVEANVRHDARAVDEALQILEHQRETWKVLLDKLTGESPSTAAVRPAATASSNPILSVQG